MKHIIVTKFGNEPDVFGDSLRCGMIGDWETRQLIKALSDNKENYVTYYGKAIWRNREAKLYFGDNVQFIECKDTDNADMIAKMATIDEFHVILGPHSIYNGGKNIPSWESIKKSIVTERMLNRVAPQVRLMNSCPDAMKFFYLSDRRFLLQAADLDYKHSRILAQCLDRTEYMRPVLDNDNYTDFSLVRTNVVPFRFETLWFYDKSMQQMNANYLNEKPYGLAVPANQVVADSEIEFSRRNKLLEFTDYFSDFSIIGKWTHESTRTMFNDCSKQKHYLDGLAINDYNDLLSKYKFALVVFNTDDGPSCFDNNWLTLKYWECVYAGCITFVERGRTSLPVIPEKFQVQNGKELYEKIERCIKDKDYAENLTNIQRSMVNPDYFNSAYFTKFMNRERQIYGKQ